MIDINDFQPVLRMGITTDEELFIAKRLLTMVKKANNKILYLAPGNMLIPIYLSLNLGEEIYAVDDWKYFPKSEAERLIKKYDAKVSLFDGLPNIPFPDSSFDLIFSVMYLYNFRRDSMKNAVKEIIRVLDKSSGEVLVVDTILVRGKVKREMESEGLSLKDYSEANALFFSRWGATAL